MRRSSRCWQLPHGFQEPPGSPISSEIHKQVELGGHVTDRAAAGKGGHRVRFEVWLFTGLAETKQD